MTADRGQVPQGLETSAPSDGSLPFLACMRDPPHAPNLTSDRLRAVLDYDPETGIFRWRVQRGGMRAGALAGCAAPDGVLIAIDYRQHRAARLAFLYMTGAWPPAEIDFLDHDNLNNRWNNLRPATSAQNHAYQRTPRNSRTGIKGVWWDATVKRWAGQVIHAGRVYKRHFETIGSAARYVRAKREQLHGDFACHE